MLSPQTSFSLLYRYILHQEEMVDSEEKRFVDRIRAITFREAKEAGAAFITRQWVAQLIGRSEEFVKNNWRRDPHDCK